MNTRQQMAQNAAQPSVEGPPTFKFTQVGEEVFGEVISARFDFQTQNGIGHVIEVRDEQRGDITVWLTSAQLDAGLVQGRNQLGRRVQVSDTVYIRFDGKVSLDGGKTLNTYSINVAPGQPPAGPGPQQVPAPQQVRAPQPQQHQTVGQAPVTNQWQQPPNGQQQQWPAQGQPQPQQQQADQPQNVPF